MKYFFIFLLLTSPLHAQIFADFETTEGDFTVELYHELAPKTVANFIGLAQGTRPWIDSITGRVRTTPFYEGITFHRVIDGFVNQFGSRNGQGTDGPGYSFRDEFNPSLDFSTPYLFAMANSGPNTNGSQLFITVGTPTNLNNVHTILGFIPDDGSSRQTVDTINTVETTSDTPNTPITITTVTIRREGTSAQNFDELAQDLPIPTAPSSQLQNITTLQLPLQNNSILQIYRSTDLSSWSLQTDLLPIYYDSTQTLPINTTLPTTLNTAEFFRPSLTIYPNPPYIPNSLEANTVININTTLGSTTYTFTSLNNGTFSHTNTDNTIETGSFNASIDQITPIRARLTLFPQLTDSDGNLYAVQTTVSRYETNNPNQLSGVHNGSLFTFNTVTQDFRFTNSEADSFSINL